MKKVIMNFNELSDSKEMLEGKEPNFIIFFIYFVLIIFVIAFIWMWIGEIDIVVKASGMVRPASNISIIRNATGGNIQTINYVNTKEVEKGDILYSLDISLLNLKYNSLLEEKRRLEKELKLLKKFELSIKNDKNIFKEEEIKYYNRFLVYKTNHEQLIIDFTQAQNNYFRKKSLYPGSISKSQLEELKSTMDYTELEMKKYRSEILLNIKNEIEKNKEKIIQLKQEIADITEKINFSKIKAPIGGIIQSIQKFNEGDYLPAGIEVLRIIPSKNSKLNMDITVRNEDISQLEKGQEVKYRLLSLPYKEYGTLTGKIEKISSDVNPDKINSGLPYNVVATIDELILYDKKGKVEYIKVGMLSKARIIVRQKKILYIVLEKLDFLS